MYKYSTVKRRSKGRGSPTSKGAPTVWVELTEHNSYEYHYNDAMNLIRDLGGSVQYSTVQYERNEGRRVAHIKGRSHSVGGATN